MAIPKKQKQKAKKKKKDIHLKINIPFNEAVKVAFTPIRKKQPSPLQQNFV